MKKITISLLALATCFSFYSCEKEEIKNSDNQSDKKVTVKVTTESVQNPTTKVSIVESGSNFNLYWQSSDKFGIGYSGGTEYKKGEDAFTVSGISENAATFTGTLPGSGSGTTNYMAALNFFSSTASMIRAEIPNIQTYYADGAIATNCLLVARTDGATYGELNSLAFKTMNGFLKFSLKKGAAAGGSSNTYDHMYVQNIKVETIADGEALAGRFGFAKTGAWGSAYDETVSTFSAVTLNCVTDTFTNGVDLSASTATDFYVAVAFGTYTKGLKVTITVKNESGDFGVFEKTISNGSSLSVARNTMRSFSTLTVNPTDAISETVLWTENWTGGSDATAPSAYLAASHTGTFVYNDETISYTQSSTSNVKLYTDGTMYAGGASPELYIKKSSTWTISNIPTTGASKVALTYKSNNTNGVVSCSTAGTTITGSSKSYVITTGGATKITLVFTASGGNTRIDDVELKVTN